MQFGSYNMVIKPAVTCACKMWIMKLQIEWQLSIFKRKILQKIFGLNKQAYGFWRINTNEEFDKLNKRKNTVREIKFKKSHMIRAFRKPGRTSVS